MTASAIGLIIIYGTTSFMVQMKHQFSSLEKDVRRLHAQSFFNNIISSPFACRNTLSGHWLPPAATGTTKRRTALRRLKNSRNEEVLFFGSDGWSPDERTKRKLKELGLDDFSRMEFVYDNSRPSQGEIHVYTHPDKGVFREPLKFTLSDVTVSGDFVTSCNGSSNPCGPEVAGRAHQRGGGFKAATATVHSNVHVGPNAGVCDTAHLSGNVEVKNFAIVSGNARIAGQTVIKDSASVRGGTLRGGTISGNSSLKNVRAANNVTLNVYESARVEGITVSRGGIFNKTVTIRGEAQVIGQTVQLYTPVTISGGVVSGGNIGGGAQISGGKISGGTIGTLSSDYGGVAVSGGEISGGNIGDGGASNSIQISGGKISGGIIGRSGNCPIYISGGEISGGTIYGNDGVSSIRISGGKISGGNIKADGPGVPFRISGGEISGGSIINSFIQDNAKISGNPSIKWAIVKDNAKISGAANLEGTAYASDGLTVEGFAEVRGGQIKDKAKISEHAKIMNHSAGGSAIVKGSAKVKGHVQFYHGLIDGTAEADGHVKICNPYGGYTTHLGGDAKLSGTGSFCSILTSGTQTLSAARCQSRDCP